MGPTPPTQPPSIDPQLLELTKAALTGLLSNPKTDNWGAKTTASRSVEIAKYTLETLIKRAVNGTLL